jgi:bacterioferritin-associated ferredoxin
MASCANRWLQPPDVRHVAEHCGSNNQSVKTTEIKTFCVYGSNFGKCIPAVRQLMQWKYVGNLELIVHPANLSELRY